MNGEKVCMVPQKILEKPAKIKGAIESLKYRTKAYGEDERTLEKRAYIYLPQGYTKEKQYPVLYLMHGGGESEKYWFFEHPETVWMIENMIAEGLCSPLLIVTPTFYPGDREIDREKDKKLPYNFHRELRCDLIPAVEGAYAAGAAGNVSEENLRNTRESRGFAGLSMGSMTTYFSALIRCLDLFAWYGAYSGCTGPAGDREKAAAAITDALERTFAEYSVSYLLACNGTEDIAHDEHAKVMRLVEQKTGKLRRGENYRFIDIPGAKHDYAAWQQDLYETLQIFFS